MSKKREVKQELKQGAKQKDSEVVKYYALRGEEMKDDGFPIKNHYKPEKQQMVKRISSSMSQAHVMTADSPNPGVRRSARPRNQVHIPDFE